MKTSSATKRRRRKDRRFRELCDVLSSRIAMVAALAAFGFVMMQVGRTYFPVQSDTAVVDRVNTGWSGGRLGLNRS